MNESAGVWVLLLMFALVLLYAAMERGCCVTIDGQEHCLSLKGGGE